MGAMSVTPAEVMRLAGGLRKDAHDIADALEHLESTVNALRPSWSGQAQASYDDAQRKWSRELADMQQLLENIASKTEQISSGYTDTDSQAAKRFSI